MPFAELPDHDPSTGHRHDCITVGAARPGEPDCGCTLQLYELATNLDQQLTECDQMVQEHDAEG